MYNPLHLAFISIICFTLPFYQNMCVCENVAKVEKEGVWLSVVTVRDDIENIKFNWYGNNLFDGT